MNRITITGHMAKDPELRTTQSGISQCTFTVAVQRRYKNQDGKREADFLPVVAWRQTAEFAAKYLTKGRLVAVDGSVQTRSYTGQDGNKRYVTEIIADHVEALGSREDNKPADAPAAPPQRNEQQRMDMSGFTEVEDEKLPWEE
jgi:single-strand DNA-binding protein